MTGSTRYQLIGFWLTALAVWVITASIAEAYTITPKFIDLSLEKRDIIERTITLTNSSQRAARIYPTVNEVAVDENGEIRQFEQAVGDERKISVTSWIELGRGRITLQPGETKEVPVTFRINPQAEAGEYHAFLGFINASNKDAAKKRAIAGNGPGVLVKISLDKERTEFSRLSGFTVERFVTNPADDVVAYNVVNSGEKEIVPRGEVILYNNRGYEIGAVPVNPDGQSINPGENVVFTSSLPEDLGAGKYKAFLSLEYGSDQLASINDTVFFYVTPLSTMLVIFFSVLVFALLLTYWIHRRLSLQAEAVETHSVNMYLRDGTSDPHEHDIDLKQK